MLYRTLAAFMVAWSAPVRAEPVTITGGEVYVTRNDCLAFTQHHPAPDVAFKSGVDSHGKYVAPADLSSQTMSGLVPDTIPFDLRINPLAYGRGAPSARFANTQTPIAHVDIDMKTGEARLNGQSLSGDQNHVVMEACRKAGIR
jgi:hypothetical protein